MLTAAVAAVTAQSSGYLRACLQQTGLVESVAEWTMSPEQFPPPGQSVPDVVLLELSSNQEACFSFAAHLRRLRATVCTIVCAPTRDPRPELLMEAMRNGVREFLPQPLDPQHLQETLQRLGQEREHTAPREATSSLAVMGAKGGVGTTTVAVNLAVQIAVRTQKRTLLLDFARPVGHASLLLDLQPRFSIVDAVENLERLDSHFLNGLTTHHKSGLEVLAGTSSSDLWGKLSPQALARIINVAQGTSNFVVMDLGSMYSWEWNVALRKLGLVMVVSEADVPSLWTLERQLTALASGGVDPQKTHIVINRWHRSDEEALKAVEKKLKRAIYARLPNDYRQVNEAVNLGTPLSRNHNDPLVSKYRQIASDLAGAPAETNGAKAGAKTKGKPLLGFLSRA
jgi:pilus assembly protein CpaE